MTPNTPILILVSGLAIIQIVLAMGYFELNIASQQITNGKIDRLEKEISDLQVQKTQTYGTVLEKNWDGFEERSCGNLYCLEEPVFNNMTILRDALNP